VLVGGTGVFVGVSVGVLVGGTGVFVGVSVGVLVGGTGVFVGVSVGVFVDTSSSEDVLFATFAVERQVMALVCRSGAAAGSPPSVLRPANADTTVAAATAAARMNATRASRTPGDEERRMPPTPIFPARQDEVNWQLCREPVDAGRRFVYGCFAG
jgi:hypothetical protein